MLPSMKNVFHTGILLLVVLLCGSCKTAKQKETTSQNTAPDIIKCGFQKVNINPKDFKVITPGKNGIPLPKKIKVGEPEVTPYFHPSRIIPGKSFLPRTQAQYTAKKKLIKSKLPVKVKVGKTDTFPIVKNGFRVINGDTIYAPLTYSLVKQQNAGNINFMLQNGDTIDPPKTTIARQPIPVPAKSPRYKDAATLDMQYLDVDEGMSSSYVNCAIQSKNDNLWIGTWGGGVSRYSGESFAHFNEQTGLANNSIWSMLQDSKGVFWFGTWGDGVVRYDGEKFTNYTTRNGLSGNIIRSIMEDSQGNIWFGTNRGGVTRFDGHTFTHFDKKSGFTNLSVREIIEDSRGDIWFGVNHTGAIKYNGNRFVHFTKESGLANRNVHSIVEDQNGNIWFGYWGRGASCFNGKSFYHFSKEQGFTGEVIWDIISDENGNLWFGTDGDGVFMYDGEAFMQYTMREGLSSNIVTSIINDDAGNYWFMTNGAGITRFNYDSFYHFTKKQGLSSNTIRSMVEDDEGDMWFGTYGGGLNRFDGNRFYIYSKKQGLPEDMIMTIMNDNEGYLWVGTYGKGLFRFDGSYLIHYTRNNGINDNNVRYIFQDSKEDFWIATYGGGVVHFDGKSFTHITKENGLASNIVLTVFEDRTGAMWFGTYRGGMSRYDGNSIMNFTTNEGLPDNTIITFHQDYSGNVWFGTLNGGASYFNPDDIEEKGYLELHHLTQKQGLSHNGIFSIIEDHDLNLWLGSEMGLNRLQFKTCKESPVREEKVIENQIFTTFDGLKGLDFMKKSVCLDQDNNLWWGTGKSLAKLDLDKTTFHDIKPGIQLNSLLINQQFIDFHNFKDESNQKKSSGYQNPKLNNIDDIQFTGAAPFFNYPLQLELPYSLNHLTFQFAAIDWSAPHKLRYRYKLEGLDANWSQPSKSNIADYRNIPFGEYTFKVKAIGQANIWSNVYTYSFVIHPPWWHTTWARIILVILLLLLIFAIVRWRTKSLTTRQAVLEKTVQERTTEIADKNEELSQQNTEIKAQQAEITQSIDYAKRLQQSIFPDQQRLDEKVQESFVFFEPRDNVSGDFYWWSTQNGKTVVTVADCTGHGVPGAFMSMLGVSFLREIVLKEGETNPAHILNKLRIDIIRSLRQKASPGSQRDGLDMAVVSIDKKNRTITFAGAGNPVYIISQNRNNMHVDNRERIRTMNNKHFTLTEIKGDRMTVAIHPNMKPFKSVELKYESGDQLYLFSDGFADQFSQTPKGLKKFKYIPFKQMLLANADKPMHEQKTLLKTTFHAWKGNYEQIDDVVVLGIKL